MVKERRPQASESHQELLADKHVSSSIIYPPWIPFQRPRSWYDPQYLRRDKMDYKSFWFLVVQHFENYAQVHLDQCATMGENQFIQIILKEQQVRVTDSLTLRLN